MLDNFLKIISQVKRTLFTCTYVLSIGVLRTRGLGPRFALHVLFSKVSEGGGGSSIFQEGGGGPNAIHF